MKIKIQCIVNTLSKLDLECVSMTEASNGDITIAICFRYIRGLSEKFVDTSELDFKYGRFHFLIACVKLCIMDIWTNNINKMVKSM